MRFKFNVQLYGHSISDRMDMEIIKSEVKKIIKERDFKTGVAKINHIEKYGGCDLATEVEPNATPTQTESHNYTSECVEIDLLTSDLNIVDNIMNTIKEYSPTHKPIKDEQNVKIENALNILTEYSQIDGAHHKAWCLDQIARALLGTEYDQFVYDYEHDKETGETYHWDRGIAP